METSKFLKRVLADGGNYCLFAAKIGSPKRQTFHNTVERLLSASSKLDNDGFDVYFGLGAFDDTGNRKAASVMLMGSLFLDLDCGEGKAYADASEALSALNTFCKAVGMPQPLMVHSGYGVHVYWPLTEPMAVAEWRPVAIALKRACAEHGLMIDNAVPADAARVLRIPGSNNYKFNTSAPVHVLGVAKGVKQDLSWFSDLLDADAPAPAAMVSPSLFANVKMRIEDDPVMQKLLRNRENSFKKIAQKSCAGNGCAQLAFIMTEQEKVDEPLWRAGLSIAKFCNDGAKAAHVISRGHPEYNAETTASKLEVIVGPYICDTFDDLRPGVCGDCPFRGKIKSPIQLGAVVAEADTWEVEDEVTGEPTVVYKNESGDIPRFPFPFKRGKNGGIYVEEDNEDGLPEDVEVYSNDLYYTQRVLDSEIGECVLGKVQLPNDTIREFLLPLVAATSKEELRKILSKHGVVVSAKKWDIIMAYTQRWIEELQTTTVADTARTQFGWTDDDFTSYVIGSREIFADSIGYNPPSSKTAYLFPAFKPVGTLEGWVDQANFYNREGLEPYQFLLCQALAAPLMRLTPVHAAIFDFYSDGSGHGKSTTQKFACTVYGDPGELIVGPKDTLNMRLNRMEIMMDVNLQFDEFTEFPAADTSDLIYGITDGRQKGRMSSGSNEERFRGKPWHTTVTSSSNHSMLAKVYAVKSKPEAEEQRLLRYHVQPHNFTDKSETDMFAKGVGKNAGHAAEVFVQHMMRDLDTAKQLLESVQRKLDVACGLTMQNRMWSVQGAVTITALILAREAGLLTYDPAKLFKWVVQLINANKTDAVEAKISVEAIINDFVHEHYGSILWIKSTDDLRGLANGNGLDSLVVPEMQPKMKLVARYETDVKFLYITMRSFKVWCTKQRLNYDSVVSELGEKMGARKQKIRMSKGTKLNLPAATVLSIDCASLDLPETPNGGSTT